MDDETETPERTDLTNSTGREPTTPSSEHDKTDATGEPYDAAKEEARLIANEATDDNPARQPNQPADDPDLTATTERVDVVDSTSGDAERGSDEQRKAAALEEAEHVDTDEAPASEGRTLADEPAEARNSN